MNQIRYFYAVAYNTIYPILAAPDTNKFKTDAEKSILDGAKPIIELICFILMIPCAITAIIMIQKLLSQFHKYQNDQGTQHVEAYALGLIGCFAAMVLLGSAGAWAAGWIG